MTPFGASRAGLMSVREDAIPDSEVWQSEESSRDFWEETGELWFLEEDSDTDILISSQFGEGNGTENMFARRSEWELETDNIDVTETFSRGVKEWLWFVENDRYVHEQRKPPDLDSDRDTAIIVLGPWDVTGADTIFYDLNLAGDESSTVGMSLSLAEPGTSDASEVTIIEEIESQESADDSEDISQLNGEKELVVMSNSGSGNSEFNNQSVDIFFD